MRFLTLLAVLPLAFSLVPVAIVAEIDSPATLAAVAESKVEVFVNAKGAPIKCYDYITRRENCQCRDGLMKPDGYKPGGQQPKDNCRCGDPKNSVGYYNAKGWLKCSCPNADNDGIAGNDQYYNYDDNRCNCEDSLIEVRVNDKLKCKVKGPKPSPKAGSNTRRDLKAALEQRRLDAGSRAVEATLMCKASEKACQVYDQWSCVEVMSSLATCGGCAGEAVDCGSLPNVSEVHCAAGQCVIDSCARGYKLTSPVAADGTSTTQARTCESIRRAGSSWFGIQGEGL